MAFEDIEFVGAPKVATSKLPAHGVAVIARAVAKRKGGGSARYIRVQNGAGLAKAIALTQPEHKLRLLFGTGSDAGKVRVSVDNAAGKFAVRRDKRGNYSLTINAATADGLFALTFPGFTEDRCEAMRPANGQPPHFVFKASAQMLAVEED